MEQVVESFAHGYSKVAQAIEGLSEEAVNFKPNPNSWSVKEIIVHLADTESVLIQRMKKVLSEDNPLLTAFDQDQWADRLEYAAADFSVSLELIRLQRESFLPTLRRLKPEEWQRAGIHTEIGKLTFSDIAHKAVSHLEGHLGQIERVLQAYANR